MRIVYISNSILPSKMANSIHVMKMCRAFAEIGHKIVLLAPDTNMDKEDDISDLYAYYGVPKCFKIKKVKCLRVKSHNLFYPTNCLREISRMKPDLVYSRNLLGSVLASRKGFNTIFEAHSPMQNSHPLKRYYFKKYISQKYFRRLVVISSALKKMYLEYFQIPKEKIVVAHDAADKIKDNKPLNNWPGRKNALQVGYTGHLYAGRGIGLIIDLASKLKDVDFHLMGGTEEDIRFWKIRKKSQNIYFHGFIAPGLVYKYRNNCDVLLAPYEKKVAIAGGKGNTMNFMSPLKIFEYMSSKKAIISSDLPVLREVLDEKNAILADIGKPDEWTTAVKLLQKPKKRNELALNAYNDFKNKYTWHSRAINVLSTLQIA